MGRKINTNVKTIEKARSLGLKINTDNLHYDKSANRVFANVGKGLRKYVSASAAGGEKEMFFAAAGYRNFFKKYDKQPSATQVAKIMVRAKNAEKSEHIWSRRYDKKGKKGAFVKEPADIKPTAEIKFDTPSLFDMSIVDKAKTKTVKKEPRPTKTTQNKLHELDVNISKDGLTYTSTPKGEVVILIRIKVGSEHIYSSVKAKDYRNERQMMMAAHEIRGYIYKHGEKPGKELKASMIRTANKLGLSSIPSRTKIVATTRMNVSHSPVIGGATCSADGTKNWAVRGVKSNKTAAKIKELSLEIKPDFLTYIPGDCNKIIIRMTTGNGFQSTGVSGLDVGMDETALFDAAADLREHIMKTGLSPSKEARLVIIRNTVIETDKRKVASEMFINKQIAKLEQTARKESNHLVAPTSPHGRWNTDDQIPMPLPSEESPRMLDETGAHNAHSEKYKATANQGIFSRAKKWFGLN